MTISPMSRSKYSIINQLDSSAFAGTTTASSQKEWTADELLTKWNDTHSTFPDVCVHELFEEQVARTPNATAVFGGGRILTYRELNARANQVAWYLRAAGIGPENLVGICMDRSPELVVALLGVWKAGGAYVPLDPSYPQERIAFMVGDAAVSALLTEETHKHLFSAANTRVTCLDSDWQTIAQFSDGNPDHRANPSNLAYVMYTSGSTGQPKGAMIVHRGLVNYLWWAIHEYKVREGGSVPVHSSISFDLTVTSLYPALLSGGQVELLGNDVGALNLLRALREGSRRSLVKITPAHLEAISLQLSASEKKGLTDLFVIGGESLLAENLRAWREASPDTRLINEYGPTETVVGCCVYEVEQDDPHNGPVPIGRPIANMRMYVLDENRKPLLPGVIGELYIGGVGVARGYLNRKALTEERFLPDPFSDNQEARMYKTGDLVRYREDGVLEYFGRSDDQVKVRGYRIELGEIEAVLASWPSAQSCVVLARQDVPGDRQLVGYVVPRGNKTPDVSALQDFLKKQLPEYMVPVRFVFMKSFPLTPNGKIDRKALPLSTEYAKQTKRTVAPSDSLEQMLVGIWERVLKVKPIGVTDDFFELGGHSLLAVRLSVEVERVFQVRLSLATFLEAPNISALAEHLRQQNWKPSWSSLVPIRTKGSRPPLFLMHSHGGNTLEYHALANLLDEDQPVYSLQSRGLDGHIRANLTIEEMATTYIEEIRSVRPEGPYYLGGFCLGGILALEAAQQLTEAGEKVPFVFLIQSIHPQLLGFAPETSTLQRWWYTINKRLDLEREWLSTGGKGHITDRARFILKNLLPKAALALGYVKVKDDADLSGLSTHYILEALAQEHTRAMRNYVPRPYKGNAIVFRAGKQLRGIKAGRDLGWQSIFEGQLEIIEIEGHQQNIMLHPHVEQLATELAPRIAVAQQEETPTKARKKMFFA